MCCYFLPIQGHQWSDKLKVTINFNGVLRRTNILFISLVVVGCSHINYLIFDMLQCLCLCSHLHTTHIRMLSEYSLILVQPHAALLLVCSLARTRYLLAAAVVDIVAEKKHHDHNEQCCCVEFLLMLCAAHNCQCTNTKKIKTKCSRQQNSHNYSIEFNFVAIVGHQAF